MLVPAVMGSVPEECLLGSMTTDAVCGDLNVRDCEDIVLIDWLLWSMALCLMWVQVRLDGGGLGKCC